MKKLFAVIAMAMGLGMSTAVAEVPIKDAVVMLQESVVPLKNGSSKYCTAFKVGTKQFMTAAHCAVSVDDDTKVDSNYTYQFVETMMLPVVRKKDDKRNDWAVLNMLTENSKLKALTLGCEEELYVGQRIASMGFPATVGRGQLDRAFVTGYISSLSGPDSKYLNQDFVVDMPAAPGASGSPVISLDTGNVIGVLVELTTGDRSGSILTGIQNIPEFLCHKTVQDNKSVTQAPTYSEEDARYTPF